MLPISVIVPVRNSEHLVEGCLTSILKANPAEVIVVDGMSTDKTLEIIKRFPVAILSDEGLGVPAARMLGIRAAQHITIGLFDVDIKMSDGALEQLYQEFISGGYDALQAGLTSYSSSGYWGRALAHHHNHGRSKRWPGLMATLFKRQVLLDHPLDERFRSGEDIEIRWRLKNTGYLMGVSKETTVQHWFGDTYAFAKDQWQQDGKGLGRMVNKYGIKSLHLLAIPAAGALRGVFMSIARLQPGWIPYYLGYLFYNYASIISGLSERYENPNLWMQPTANP